jgi:hypothetical protein
MKLVLAAPDSGLPSLLIAISSQHFFIELILAAPARGLPSFDIALVSQEFAAKADPVAKVSNTAAIAKRFMAFSLFVSLIHDVGSRRLRLLDTDHEE